MPIVAPPKVVLEDITTGAVAGTGNFDKLMQTMSLHMEQEYKKGRIVGKEYSTVYLGALNHVLDKAVEFTLEVDKSWLEIEVLRLQAEKLEVEKLKVSAETDLINAQIPKIQQETLNLVKEGVVLDKTACKLAAEFDLILEQKVKVAMETTLLNQKVATEKAQTDGTNIDALSVLGKQISLYGAQTSGFYRDAEQKGTEILVKSWSVRRTTDDATPADATNKLADKYIGMGVDRLLIGMGADPSQA